VIDFRGDERGGYTAFATGAPLRVALHYPFLTWMRNHLFTHLVAPPGELPRVGAADLSLYILRAFGIEANDTVPELRLSAEVRRRAAEILAGADRALARKEAEEEKAAPLPAAGGWVTLNPFSRWAYKEWAPDKWIQVIDWLWGHFGLAVVVVGSPGERERAAGLIRDCPGRVFNLAGKTTLAELAGVLEQSRLHIGVDSAGPHIAAAVGTPTVTLYGPSDWRYWAPRGKGHRVVVPDMPCVPCHRKGCDGLETSLCLETLEVSRVQAVVAEALAPSEGPGPVTPREASPRR